MQWKMQAQTPLKLVMRELTNYNTKKSAFVLQLLLLLIRYKQTLKLTILEEVN